MRIILAVMAGCLLYRLLEFTLIVSLAHWGQI